MKIAVVYGGYSSEKDASAENAKYINEALKKKGYDTCMIEYGRELVKKLHSENTEFVYVCVQGKGHGDGTIQAVLEQEKIPFTGSGAHAAALINDKIVSKLLFEKAGVLTPHWEIVTKEEYESGSFDAGSFGYPFVAKAPSEGGSFGIQLIKEEQELTNMEQVFAYESPILVEKFIRGKFYTIGLLEREEGLCVLPCVEGIEVLGGKESDDPERLKVFTGDYTIREAGLPEKLVKEMEAMAVKVFKITGAKGIARVDFMVPEEQDSAYVLEINAVPGLKPKSLLPGEARLAGIAYEELIESPVRFALNNGR